MEQKLLETLKVHYVAKAARAEANLLNYFKNPAAIGGHPDVVDEMAKLVEDIGAARGGLVVLQSLVQQQEDVQSAESAGQEVEVEAPKA
jgi:hypothetical protein|tara:strand:- start:123 stop:389 length:267 start_codon:yes stop_codon:yes gene_type:complete